jgi:4-hydroxybenzoate polyprenyltransferase
MSTKPKLHWPFWVAAVWVTVSIIYSIAQWMLDSPKPNGWLWGAIVLPLLLCMWYESILRSNDEVEHQDARIRAEVEMAVRKAMKPNKIARVVDVEPESER